MYVETVEIFSDRSNMPVIGHLGRQFPGVLVQGDTLHTLCAQATKALWDRPDVRDELQDLHNKLLSMPAHYKTVFNEHQFALPFVETLMPNYSFRPKLLSDAA
ncbi:DUF6959 family protein [Xanthomonas sp. F14]